uniref:disks large homolog 5-like n=1 Tax=Arvicanthis niloticus TaxID=61156 RepID=UPI00402BE4F5
MKQREISSIERSCQGVSPESKERLQERAPQKLVNVGQEPLGSQAVMLSMLLRLFHRDNTIQPETRPRQKAFCKARRRRWPWGRHRSVGKESSQAYTISEQEQRMKRLEKLKRDLQRMNNERDKLRGILAHYTNKDLNNRFNFDTMMLEMQHDQVMTDLKHIPQQISEALYKCQELTKNNQLYCIRSCHLLTESLHMKSEVKMLWNENRQLFKEQITLEVCSKETRRLCVEASMKIYDKYSKHIQQVGCMKNDQEQVALMSNHKQCQAQITILHLIQALS